MKREELHRLKYESQSFWHFGLRHILWWASCCAFKTNVDADVGSVLKKPQESEAPLSYKVRRWQKRLLPPPLLPDRLYRIKTPKHRIAFSPTLGQAVPKSVLGIYNLNLTFQPQKKKDNQKLNTKIWNICYQICYQILFYSVLSIYLYSIK